jgi:hypothetical protein
MLSTFVGPRGWVALAALAASLCAAAPPARAAWTPFRLRGSHAVPAADGPTAGAGDTPSTTHQVRLLASTDAPTTPQDAHSAQKRALPDVATLTTAADFASATLAAVASLAATLIAAAGLGAVAFSVLGLLARRSADGPLAAPRLSARPFPQLRPRA